jgi:hypothetical protein
MSKNKKPSPNKPGDHDPAEVTQHQLLARKMPSVLSQLKPMAKTSVDMLRYLDTDRSPEITK